MAAEKLLQCYSWNPTTKDFSALSARLANGQTIEEIYQQSKRDQYGCKYNRPKGQKPEMLSFFGRLHPYSNTLRHNWYNALWYLYFMERPDLLREALGYDGFYEKYPYDVFYPAAQAFMQDPFASAQGCNQARTIAWLMYTYKTDIDFLFCDEVKQVMLGYWKEIHPGSFHLASMGTCLMQGVAQAPGFYYKVIERDRDGNIQRFSDIALDTAHQTLVNPVNCRGVMGAGVALAFNEAFAMTDYFDRYKAICNRGEFKPGMIWCWPCPDRMQQILSVSTKGEIHQGSRIEWIHDILNKIVEKQKAWRISSLAIPVIGAGRGGLDRGLVIELITKTLAPMQIPITIYVERSDKLLPPPPML